MSNRGDESGGCLLRRARYRSAERPEGSGQRGSEQGGVDAWAAYLEQRRVVPGSDDPETASVFQSPAFHSVQLQIGNNQAQGTEETPFYCALELATLGVALFC